MHRLSACVGSILLMVCLALPARGAEEAAFGAVSTAMVDDGSSLGLEISGQFEKAGGAVTVGEMPPYVNPQDGLVMMVSVIARAGTRLLERCSVAENYPIKVIVNGSTCHTTAGRCRDFLKNPCVEEVDTFWAIPAQAG